MPPVIDAGKCSRCGLCAAICPLGVFEQTERKTVPAVRYGEECWHCNACRLDCPSGAITLRIPLNYQLLHTDASQLHR